MKKTLFFLFSAFAACAFPASARQHLSLADPAGRMTLDLYVGTSGIEYALTHDGTTVIDRSPVSLTLAGGTVWGADPKIEHVVRRSVDTVIFPPVYRKDRIRDRFNELTVDFEGGYGMVFRAYEDGVAYRFVARGGSPFVVESEQASFNIPGDPCAYAAYPKGRMNNGAPDPFYSSFQNTYTHRPLSEWNDGTIAMLPLLVESAGGRKLCITEADLIDYPGMYLRNDAGNVLRGVHAAYPKELRRQTRGLKCVVQSREPYIARMDGRSPLPWRVIVVSENDAQLLDNDMVYKLATPASGSDYSWVRPGKVAWEWWNNWNLRGVDFETGVNDDTYKYYIDFAAAKGIEYVILDEGWAVEGEADLFRVVPEIDLPGLVNYAAERGVGIILWAGYYAFDRDMENVCRHYAAMGVKGFKIDFMDRDDQYMIHFNYRAAQMGEKYRLLIDLHGTSKPTGLQRTFPGTVNFEGVHGLEEMKWAKEGTDQVTYDVTFPFIRMVAGPVDYTQGAMRNATKENFRTVYTEPMSQGTRCRQMAQYVIFESPLNMLCDTPSNYLREQECTDFIAAVPTCWDETRPLAGEVGHCVAVARRRGAVWYVGAMTGWEPREMEFDLSFLGAGDFWAEIFRDGVNAGKAAQDYRREVLPVPADRKLRVKMAPGGGTVMKIGKK